MAILEVTNEHLRLIQKALDMYSRIGIGQMWVIKDHPTFYNVLRDKLQPQKQLEIGDQTERGKVVEIGEGYIKTSGKWDGEEEIRIWTDIDEIKLSMDYGLYHQIRDEADKILSEGRNKLLQEDMHKHASYGIYNPHEVDESCRVAFDLIQVIRHEFWKNNPNRTTYTVDSSLHLSTKESQKIKCKIDE